MDKITRTLLLYSRLMKGEKINKFAFCMETDCIPRTFDRDIEDIRLYLSEIFDTRELLYDRYEKSYYLSGVLRSELETIEYQLIERILLDAKVLRKDELEGLLQHVLSNTEQSVLNPNSQSETLKNYKEPIHKKALLKIHGDLEVIIRNQLVIQIRFESDEEMETDIEIIPCCLRYDMGYLYLIAYQINSEKNIPTTLRLDKIHSFKVLRVQSHNERKCVDEYLKSI